MCNILEMLDQVFVDFILVAAHKSFPTFRTLHEAVTGVMVQQRITLHSNIIPAQRVGDTEVPVDREISLHVEVFLDVTDGC